MFRCAFTLFLVFISNTYGQNNKATYGNSLQVVGLRQLHFRNTSSVADPDINKIVGGQPISIQRVPWQVAVFKDNSFICGGSIISNIWVLTAAHCVYRYKSSKFSVQAGSNLLSSGGETRNVKLVVINGRYDPKTHDVDIAMLKVSKPFTFSTSLQPVTLASKDSTIPQNLFVSGWGILRENNTIPSTELRGVSVKLIAHNVCVQAYKKYNNITLDVICAARPGKDSCQGDSGGPLVNKGVQFGIVSSGRGCARPNFPGLYTNVGRQRNWINKVIQNY